MAAQRPSVFTVLSRATVRHKLSGSLCFTPSQFISQTHHKPLRSLTSFKMSEIVHPTIKGKSGTSDILEALKL